ncbi:serine hydrolase domain-containing protein [Desulfitobacterium hafniense]|uniref:Beta-lactamase-related domain-containing protein n=4 Tax=root TaxID=1 RepID=Q251A4_DESHY|nr:serine hydrolase [Desulfitobacterium hafniense]EHL08031.1 beta-lactamase [Desulfitobacterium hafniense DP7]KTE91627.1 serine hydrolase [Desulfitobacterium hafniense]MEA5025857.1 serine hydrolase [Desulfitobacterium hafniense]CDX00341.1 Beta-lactamase [Desulfitobacterium hafniense]BAE82138.1 hypothetical protein DSY0349 [Desulfitobacterium hafniense Y51]
MKSKILLLMAMLIGSVYLTGCGRIAEPEQGTVMEEREQQNPEQRDVLVWEWQYGAPEDHGLNGDTLESLHATYDTTQILASVIFKDGHIVDEYYKDGYDKASLFLLHSCSKSVTSALIGIAIDKGYIESVDVPIAEYFPQILESDDNRLKQITLGHLLTNTSGFDSSDTEYWREWRNSENWVDFVLNRPLTSTPGTVFSYSTGNTHLLAAILQKATGKTAYEFGKEFLFDLIGMDSVQCNMDSQGISDGGNGFSMTVYDMVKFGLLYYHGGLWGEQQIISREWVEESTRLQFKRSSGTADYGYQWWVRTFGEEQYDTFFAQGHGGQYIFVIPELELIIAFTSNHTGSSDMYWQFVNDIVAASD